MSGRPVAADLAPLAPEAEVAVIGALLIAPDRLPACRRLLDRRSFARPLCAAAWEAIVALADGGTTPDLVTVPDRVAHATGRTIGEVSAALTGMMASPSVVGVYAAHYARIVHDAAVRRGVIQAAGQAAAWAYDESADLDGMLAAVRSLFEVHDDRLARSESGDVAAAWADLERGVGEAGYSTGIACYDRWTPGLRPGEVHVIGGYTGSGKTWAACGIASSVLDQGGRVAVFSLEMPARSVLRRMLAYRVGPAAWRYGHEDATFLADELAAIGDARQVLAGGRLSIFARQASADAISAVVRQIGADVAVVDFAQIMAPPSERQSEYEALTENARLLQVLAQRAGCSVLLLSQINEASQRSQSDALGLKGSGSLGSVADFVLRVKRDRESTESGLVILEAAKARHGLDVHQGARESVVMDWRTGRILPTGPGPRDARGNGFAALSMPVAARAEVPA